MKRSKVLGLYALLFIVLQFIAFVAARGVIGVVTLFPPYSLMEGWVVTFMAHVIFGAIAAVIWVIIFPDNQRGI